MPYPVDVNAPPEILPPAASAAAPDLPPMGNEPVELPASFASQAGRPGVGVVGSHAYRVGIQSWSPEQAAAFAARQAVLENQRQAADAAANQAALQERLIREVEAKDQIKAEQMRIQYMAQRQAHQELSAGVPPAQVYLKYPQAFGAVPGAALAAALRPQPAAVPRLTPGTVIPIPTGQATPPRNMIWSGTHLIDVAESATPKGPEVAALRALGAMASEGLWGDRDNPELKEDLKAAREGLKNIIQRGRQTAVAPPPGAPLTRELAQEFLRGADGDKEKARRLAREAGYTF